MGRPRRRGRDINGILLLDKPPGFSSNDVLQKIKRLFGANRAGHTGALDPLATGMLPICLGEATKFSQFLLNADKHYHVIARLGQRTDTSDAAGKLLDEKEIKFTQAQLDNALESLRGESLQIPSMYSALKYQGRPLYDYARQGIEVERETRAISIFDLQFIRWQGHDLELQIHCSKGTYIRTLIDDLGELLGCGAHVSQLRRLQVATYPPERMLTLTQLNTIVESTPSSPYPMLDQLLLPMDSAVVNFPEVNLLPMVAAYLKQGQPVQVSSAPAEGMVRITEGEGHHFIGIGIIDDDGRVAPKRLVNVLT
ncbi:tRNA pseudouridine 55 synthase [Candidatus Regiella insecticola 5.15]|uniref:tRNA pseudouridine synthase B n=1 Tax=Candidatus Regiella insecticola 5.15 TaxID=1005043 RepID=G2H158_9ENTR|nr:tRNA pseudouridine(55) synthase TruB [Candidatus Regiella insecticola]EGY28268.1 tRNA pseudouridine 55 synthase [Candidatus Regiella insecticola 5.15]